MKTVAELETATTRNSAPRISGRRKRHEIALREEALGGDVAELETAISRNSAPENFRAPKAA